MKITAKSDLKQEAVMMRNKRTVLLTQIRTRLRQVSFLLENRVKVEFSRTSPPTVDTGRARASWGHWTVGDIVKKNPLARPSDAVWEEKDDGLSITQGSNVEYISDLNDNPRHRFHGTLELAERWAQEALDKAVDDIMRTW